MKLAGLVLLVIFIYIAAFLVGGLFWMLLLHFAANVFNQPDLAIGYWESVMVGVIASIVAGGISALFSRR